jgi:hypothetical protein
MTAEFGRDPEKKRVRAHQNGGAIATHPRNKLDELID